MFFKRLMTLEGVSLGFKAGLLGEEKLQNTLESVSDIGLEVVFWG